jgi:hypothetical protein
MVLILGKETTDVKTNMMLQTMKTKKDKYNIVKRLDQIKIEYVKKEEIELEEKEKEQEKKLTTK